MNIFQYPQGSAEWHAYRATARNASDAPAVLGCSPYVTRSELLRVRHTGVRPDVDAVTQRRFDEGHAIEEAQRANAELIVGEELFPVVGSEDVDGLELSASFDGLNMLEDTGLEVKTLNDDLRAVLSALGGIEENDCRALPKHYRVQMEQQCMVAGCERILFVAADRTGDDVRRCWYYPDMELRAEILAAWRQFDKDLASYEAPAIDVKPEGRTPESLPALRIEVRGQVTASNLQAFREHAVEVFGGINRDLQTDQDFADAEKIVKWCSDVESRLDAAKQHVQSQMESVDEVFRTVDDIKSIARSTRLELAKLVDQRKIEIKEGLIRAGRTAYTEHVQALREETGGVWVDLDMPDFAGAAKGKRSVASIRDAVETMLANAKIDADASAKRLRANVVYLDEAIKGFEFLFADRQGLCTRQLDDIKMTVSNRIEKHKLDKQREEEATRERIRREEQAKAEREAAAKVAAEKAAQEAAERAERAAAPAPVPATSQTTVEIAKRQEAATTRRVAPAERRPAKPTRPTDAQIIAALVSHFEATEEQVVGWICEMDFSAA